jgi:hypothetical protein
MIVPSNDVAAPLPLSPNSVVAVPIVVVAAPSSVVASKGTKKRKRAEKQGDGIDEDEDVTVAEMKKAIYSVTSTALVDVTSKDVLAFLGAFKLSSPRRWNDMDFLFALTLLDPSDLQNEEHGVSLAKLAPLLASNVNFRNFPVADLQDSIKCFVFDTARVKPFATGQALIDWHRDRLQQGDGKHALYHEFALSLMALPLVNAKAESVFSRHKRILGKDRTGLRTKVVNAQCLLQEDHRFKVPLHEINIAEFEHLEEHLVRVGDSGKQDAHVATVHELFAKRRKR